MVVSPLRKQHLHRVQLPSMCRHFQLRCKREEIIKMKPAGCQIQRRASHGAEKWVTAAVSQPEPPSPTGPTNWSLLQRRCTQSSEDGRPLKAALCLVTGIRETLVGCLTGGSRVRARRPAGIHARSPAALTSASAGEHMQLCLSIDTSRLFAYRLFAQVHV